jgi:hypothetical protein
MPRPLTNGKVRPTNEAYAAINKVRRRAYGNPSNLQPCDFAEGMTQDEFRQAVRKERAYELCFEGHRRMDLVRWGIYYQTVQDTYKALAKWWSYRQVVTSTMPVRSYTIEGKHELLPIPQREMDLCPSFTQNPNW